MLYIWFLYQSAHAAYKPAVLHVLQTPQNVGHLHYTWAERRTLKEQGLSCLLPALQTERRACPLHDKSRKGFLAQRSARTVLKGRATLWERARTICSHPTLATGNHNPKVHLHPFFCSSAIVVCDVVDIHQSPLFIHVVGCWLYVFGSLFFIGSFIFCLQNHPWYGVILITGS